MRTWLFSSISAIVFFTTANNGFARNPGDALKPGFNLYSRSQDIEVGREAAAQVREKYQQVQDPRLREYIVRIGERLAHTPAAASSGFSFSFTLLNYKEVNAFALPGGPTFVFTGLLKASDNEAQVAGVLAHEISHVVLRHGTHRASKANIVSGPARIIGIVNSFTWVGRLVNIGLGLGLDGIFLKNSREDESEADALGARIMSQAGYNPMELARFFEKLEREGGPGVPQFLSDHPSPGNRVEAVEAEVRTLPHRTYTTDSREFQEAKAAIATLPPPPDLRPADIEISAANAEGYKRLNAPQFSVEYPGSWRAKGDSESSILALAPDDGIVFVNGDPAIARGAVVSYFFADPDRSSLNVATGDLIQHLHGLDAGIRQSGTQRATVVDKQPALFTPLNSKSPLGGSEMDLLLTVDRPEGLFYLLFIAPEKDSAGARATFDHVIQSLRFEELKPRG